MGIAVPSETLGRGSDVRPPCPISPKAVDIVSAIEPDWSREQSSKWWDPGRRLIGSIRGYQRWKSRGLFGRIVSKVYVLRWRFWSVICAADIPLNTSIAGGLLIPHPNGIVLHPNCVIGPNCLIFQQVTIGSSRSISGVPRIGGHVDIGAGAKIIGDIVIGDNAQIGANAVVLCDVPAGATAVGNPARIIRKAADDAFVVNGGEADSADDTGSFRRNF